MNEQLRLLIELQEIDKITDQLKKERENLLCQIEEIKNSILEEKKKIESSKKNLSQLQIEKKNKEIDLDTKEEGIRKHLVELNAVKTNEAYRALVSEIEKDKLDKNQIEETILELMQKIEDLGLEIKQREQTIKERETESQKEIKTLEEKLAKLLEELNEKGERKKNYLEKMSPSLLMRYEKIRENKDGLAVVPIEEQYCSGCRMLLPPYLINEVRKDQSIVSCEACSRILYLPVLLAKQ